MSEDTSGLGTWKHFYRELRHAKAERFSYKATSELRALMYEYRREAALERKLAAQQRTIEVQAASVERACSCADVSSADELCDWIVGAQSELAGNARRIEELEAGYLEATERVLYLCDKIDKHNATMIERMSRFERSAPADWRGYESDETPLGIALDGGGDEVEM